MGRQRAVLDPFRRRTRPSGFMHRESPRPWRDSRRPLGLGGNAFREAALKGGRLGAEPGLARRPGRRVGGGSCRPARHRRRDRSGGFPGHGPRPCGGDPAEAACRGRPTGAVAPLPVPDTSGTHDPGQRLSPVCRGDCAGGRPAVCGLGTAPAAPGRASPRRDGQAARRAVLGGRTTRVLPLPICARSKLPRFRRPGRPSP